MADREPPPNFAEVPDEPPVPVAPSLRQRGRGAVSNPESRFLAHRHEPFDDGWTPEEAPPPRPTTLSVDQARSILSRNQSPDVPFSQSINAYRGCEHGCIYCYARPSHAYLDLSPGLDFETRLFYKPDAVKLLAGELAKKNYQCQTIALGANTDPYQPMEKKLGITRQILELLLDCRHPVSIVTKSSLIERDLDLLAQLAEKHLLQVGISLTTLDRQLARFLEPRATAPQRRLLTMRRLSQAGIPVTAMIAPVIPVLTESELEDLLEQSAAHGATQAQYILLRLPLELKELFSDWLAEHHPLKRLHVLHALEGFHQGDLYDSRFGTRQTGTGPQAELLRQRFRLAVRRWGLNQVGVSLDTTQFRAPGMRGRQMELF